MRQRKIIAFVVAFAAAGLAFLLWETREKPRVSEQGSYASLCAHEIGVAPALAKVQSSAQLPAARATVSTNQTLTVRGTLPYVLTSKEPFSKPLRLAVEEMGARFVSVRDTFVAVVEADASARRRLSADRRFSSLEECLPSEKIQDELAALLASGVTMVEAAVLALSADDRARIVSCITAGGGELLTGVINEGATIRAKLPADLVSTLTQRGEVRWLEKFVRPRLHNDLAVNPGAMNVRPAWNVHGLSGKDQVLSTSDSGIDTGDSATMHPDLRDQILGIKVVDGCTTNDLTGHGTHTVGSIVGTGKMSDGQIRGTAWGAKVYAWFCSDGTRAIYTPTDMNSLFRGSKDGTEWDEAFIHSASWGSDVTGIYDASCAEFDKYVWEHPDFLPVVSAGNAGSGSRTLGSPAGAKNVLAVGATENFRMNGDPKETAFYSSRGPSRDGRIKPDIAAPGTDILSTRSSGVNYAYGNYNDHYAFSTGTSMSCPLTAGAVALVREWLVKNAATLGLSETEPPTAALMKAVITGGADGDVTPTNDQGWGRVNIEETLFPSNRTVKLVDRIPFTHGTNIVYVIETTNAAPLDVQLVWIDYPGDETASAVKRKLVNNLDLTVESRWDIGDDRTWYGNGGTSPDSVNNLEVVRIREAKATKYIITISCPQILHDYTEGGAAALYVRGAFDPSATPEESHYVRIRERDLKFRKLDAALGAVQANETVELLDWVTLPSNVTVQTSFTLTATNDDPFASQVFRRDGAGFVVATNGFLSVSNVVFSGANETLVSVASNGVFAVTGPVDFGVVGKTVAIETAATNGFMLAAPFLSGFTLKCEAACDFGQIFGFGEAATESDFAAITSTVAKIVNFYDPDRESRGRVVGTQDGFDLVWERQAVPLDEAVGYFIDGNGTTNTAGRIDRLFEYYEQALLNGRLGDKRHIVLQESGVLSYPLTIADGLTLEGKDSPAVVVEPAAGFTLTGGSLTVSGIVFSDYVGNALFMVDGEDAHLTLGAGAVLSNLTGTNRWSGAVTVMNGTVTMLPGSEISDCFMVSTGQVAGKGGGVYLNGDGCVLNLFGGTITRCLAQTERGGGGVYAARKSVVNLKGKVRVDGNYSGNFNDYNLAMKMKADDLLIGVTKSYRAHLTVVGDLTGSRIGVCYDSMVPNVDGFGAEAGQALADIDAACDKTAAEKAFFSNTDATLNAVYDEVGGKLLWEVAPPTGDRTTPDPAIDVARIVRSETVTNYFSEIAGAVEAVDSDGLTIEILQQANFSSDLVLPAKALTIRLAPEATQAALLCRRDDCKIVVPVGCSLTVTNVHINGGLGLIGATKMLVDVRGGELTLQNGTRVCDVRGVAAQDGGNRAVSGVVVSDGGKFTMESGAVIENCRNDYENVGNASGVGAGLLVDKGTAVLNGGTITGCKAYRSAGVSVSNGGVLYMKGAVQITENTTLDGVTRSDLTIEQNSSLVLTDELAATSSIGVEDGNFTDMNVFGSVDESYAQPVFNLVASAACFFRDADPAVTGRVVTNETTALLVWATALKTTAEGAAYYKDQNGVMYNLVGEPASAEPPPDEPDPPPPDEPDPPIEEPVVTNYPTAIAFKVIERLNANTWRLVVTDRVETCRYRLLSTDDLTKGFTTTGDWVRTEAGAPAVWTNDVPSSAGQQFWRVEGTWGTNNLVIP